MKAESHASHRLRLGRISAALRGDSCRSYLRSSSFYGLGARQSSVLGEDPLFSDHDPVALIGIQALNLVPKNAAGTAAGFVGLFGYLFGAAVLAKIVMGSVANDNSLGWNATFWMFIVASLLATAFCATTWKREKQALSR